MFICVLKKNNIQDTIIQNYTQKSNSIHLNREFSSERENGLKTIYGLLMCFQERVPGKILEKENLGEIISALQTIMHTEHRSH